MNKAKKGFSLAELLISLLIISIVLAASIPTITKRMASNREYIWNWSTQNNSAFFGMGSNQGAILGYNVIPDGNLLPDTEAIDGDTADISLTAENAATSNIAKLIILKKKNTNAESNFLNSHIAFYTAGTQTNSIEYGGRLAMDSGNIALGIGSLQSLNADEEGENTALGHFTLLNNTDGIRNTAVGKKALSYNRSGDYNTALGFASLYELESKQQEDANSQNTAIGALAMENLSAGEFNTAIGSNACNALNSGSNNICIGYHAGDSILPISTEDNYGLYIGGDNNEYPLISGHTVHDDNDKELIVSSRKVEFRPFNGNGTSFEFYSNLGSTGYSTSESDNSLTSSAVFNLSNENSLTFEETDDDNAGITSSKSLEITSSESLEITSGESLEITTGDGKSLVLNDKLTIQNNDNTPTLTMDSSNFNLTGEISNCSISLKDTTSGDSFYLGSSSFTVANDDVGAKINLNTTDKKVELYSGNSGSITIEDNITLSVPYGNYIYLGGTQASYNPYIYNNDLYISGISVGSGYGGSSNATGVKAAINALSQQIQAQGGGGASDERLKNISGDSTAGLKEINALEVKNYTYKADKEKTPHVGVIAQQLQKIFPNSVFEGDDGYLRIRTEEIFYAMVNSIKELCTKIQDLTAKITGLDKRITELEEQNKLLTEQNKAFEKRLEKLEKKSAK